MKMYARCSLNYGTAYYITHHFTLRTSYFARMISLFQAQSRLVYKEQCVRIE
jgi:hypothetical protein